MHLSKNFPPVNNSISNKLLGLLLILTEGFSLKKYLIIQNFSHNSRGSHRDSLKPSHGHIGLLHEEQERQRNSLILLGAFCMPDTRLPYHPSSRWPRKTGLWFPLGRSRNCESCDLQEVKHLQRSSS